MKLCHRSAGVVALLTLSSLPAAAQQMRDAYQRARALMPAVVDSLVYHSEAQANWIGNTDRFWYRSHTRQGRRFMLVDPAADTQGSAFDHDRLAAALSAAAETTFTGGRLPFGRIDVLGDSAIAFGFAEGRWQCTLAVYTCRRTGPEAPRRRTESTSPDGRWVAFARDHNLFVRVAATGEEVQLTFDGGPDDDYIAWLPSPVQMARAGREDVEQPVAAVWAPDSRRLVTYRLDRRSAGRLTVVQHVPPDGMRPRAFTYTYALPGDVGVTVAVPFVVHVESRRVTAVQIDPLPLLYYGGPWFRWSEDGRRAWVVESARGDTAARVREIDAATGATRVVFEETSTTIVDPWIQTLEIVDGGTEMLWTSERDGWNHLYRYDGATGQLRNQVTRGPWVVRDVVAVDEDEAVVYFTASGREPGRDPYLRHLYRVGLDGNGLTLLTPEPADHAVRLSPSRRYVVDTYSRVDLPPVVVLRRTTDGRVVRELERADVADLLAAGWTLPEPFTAKARDGQTDVYGVLWRPSDFDSTRSYPVIEQIYTGPHGFHVPKSFQARSSRTWPGERLVRPLAELGFVVAMVDGLGTGRRGKAFRDHAHHNLGDGGIPDHIAVLRHLADRYPYLDLDRVGIFGHSAGGYDAAHALLTHPEFYKVGVSTAGNHDHRLDKASWNETWMGFPVGDHYEAQSNVTLAPRLQGRLLLVHGDMDQNVPPAATLRLVDALIQANKDFDLLIVPNRNHGLDDHPYVIRRRWDFFTRHLLGAEPPPPSALTDDAGN